MESTSSARLVVLRQSRIGPLPAAEPWRGLATAEYIQRRRRRSASIQEVLSERPAAGRRALAGRGLAPSGPAARRGPGARAGLQPERIDEQPVVPEPVHAGQEQVELVLGLRR